MPLYVLNSEYYKTSIIFNSEKDAQDYIRMNRLCTINELKEVMFDDRQLHNEILDHIKEYQKERKIMYEKINSKL